MQVWCLICCSNQVIGQPFRGCLNGYGMGTICTERYCLSIGRFVPLLKERNEKAMKNDDDLKRIRENAVGIELDEELARQFPVKRQ